MEKSRNEDIYNAPMGPYRGRDDRDRSSSETERFRNVAPKRRGDRGKNKTDLAGASRSDHKPSADQAQGPGDTGVGTLESPTTGVSSANDALDLRDFRVLIWIAIHQGKMKEIEHSITPVTSKSNADPSTTTTSAKLQANREMVETYLNSIHQWLICQKELKSRNAYLQASSKPLDAVERALQEMVESRMEASNIESAKSRLVEAVKLVFTLFVPLDQTGPMCAKIWGALHGVITVCLLLSY
jgi:hypothetical protein